jgi:acetyl-CoA carboxylase carboxyl transferase subunit beta
MQKRGIFQRRPTGQRAESEEQLRDLPADMFEACSACRALIYRKDLARELWVCPQCGEHLRLDARQRVEITADPGSWRELYAGLTSGDPLQFPEYAEKLAESGAKTGLDEAIVIGEARVHGCAVVLGVMDMSFRAATMGHVVGEKVCLALEHAVATRRPAVLFCASGGARVHESIIALMQMAKTSGAVGRVNDAGLPYLTVLTNPTYAGVMASFASLGDIVLAEPGAGVGFTGPRVIELSLKQKGPFHWQTAEFMFEHGLVDLIVPRKELTPTLARLLAFCLGRPPDPAGPAVAPTAGDEAQP